MVSQEKLVSITEACRILGVSETSLRQWTDEGKIKAFVTPGGRRRYQVENLKKFMTGHDKTIGIKELVNELEDTVQLHRKLAIKFIANTPWYGRLDNEAKLELAELGRQLLTLIIRYITLPAEKEETLIAIRDTGSGFGTVLAKIGLPLTDAVEAFILHRGPILDVTTRLIRKREFFSLKVADAIPLTAHIMDEALISLVASHQRYRNGTHCELP